MDELALDWTDKSVPRLFPSLSWDWLLLSHDPDRWVGWMDGTYHQTCMHKSDAQNCV